jgi:UDP-N-acetylmuramoyl-tripeptide--D-alanyl-D-alanine ligase
MLKEGINLNKILEITSGKLIQKGHELFTNVTTDSRVASSGELFVPLSGENFNGHKFINIAFEKGASGTLVKSGEKLELIEGKTYIEVKDTLKAYQTIATYVRRKLNPFVIGITGSSGKTSTKEIAFAFFSQFFPTFKSEANFNNEIGVPQTLLKLTEEHKVAIVEMGMRGRGQIAELAEIAEPDAGIITGVGSAHIELLGSRQEIAKAKWELASFLQKSGGTLVIPAYDHNLTELSQNYPQDKILLINLQKDEKSPLLLEKHWVENDRQYFEFFDKTTGKKHIAFLSVLGKHQISNSLLVLALGKILKIEYPDVIDLSFENLSGRSETIKIGKAKILNDAYNANPESMKAAIETFISISSLLPKILVLGEMRELGTHSRLEHLEIGRFCSGLDIEKLVVINESAAGIRDGFLEKSKNSEKIVFCKDNKEAAEYLKKYINSEVEILLKASRGARLEEVVSCLEQD